MDFENAAIALIDEEQQPYVHELLDFITTVNENLIDYLHRYLNIDIIHFHDDWGTQRAPFFSLETCRKMLVPYLRRIAEKTHSLGMILSFHSCGFNEPLVPAMLEAGADIWCGQNLNDWSKLSKTYGDQMIWNIAYEEYSPERFATLEEYLESAFSLWKYYAESCSGVWMSIARTHSEGLGNKFFEMTYPIGRKLLAESDSSYSQSCGFEYSL